MPDALLDSGSAFDQRKAALACWLKDRTNRMRALPHQALAIYNDQSFVAGWAVELGQGAAALSFDVLLDRQFPYSAIRIALKSQEAYGTWPHVEPGGLLCLPRRPSPSAGLEDAIAGSLSDALTLIQQCREKDFVEGEFRREFLSYWNRSTPDRANRIWSLLDPTDREPRQIAVRYGEHYTLVGETADQISTWLKNRDWTEEPTIVPAIFGVLDQAPIPPFPDRPGPLCTLLLQHCPGALALFETLPVDKHITLVLAAPSPSGDGLIAMTISAPDLKGFRKRADFNRTTKLILWKNRSQLSRLEVDRLDAAWVHGRGRNEQLAPLRAATVLLLGCGALGSQVAVRLAQSGVGGLILVDPQTLAAANVGRHALGIASVGRFKASELAKQLRPRFPHMLRIEDHTLAWQSLYERDPKLFGDASLIVACLGDWEADGALGEWQVRSGYPRPIVYGWLDEHGTAAHALALAGPSPALSCILDGDGGLRMPETEWNGDRRIQAEPACGTLFQPYGAIDVAHAEALVSRLCIDLLAGKTGAPRHRVYAGATASLHEAGGTWSAHHLQHRPPSFEGAFEYERPIIACGSCSACVERSRER